MKVTLVGPRPLLSFVICLSFSPVLMASEGVSTQPSAASTRTSVPGCAKLVCQQRAVAVDPGSSAEQAPAATRRAFPFSVRFGVGAGSFRGPEADSGLYPTVYAIDGSRVFGTKRAEIEGVALSLGVAIEEELSSAAVRWGLEERLALSTVLASDRGSALGGVMDVMIDVSEGSLPLRLGIGPSLAVSHLDVSDQSLRLPGPVVVASAAASIRWDPQGLPVAFDLSGHLGKSLNLGAGTAARDLQLTLAVPL